MSWNISRNGTGSEVAQQVGDDAEVHGEHGTIQSIAVVEAIVAVAQAIGEQYPSHSVTVQTSGHLDQNGGSGSLNISISTS